nr:hypothetical protein [Actinoplanes siamensis]
MPEMQDPRPSSPHWPTTVLPTVPAQPDDKYRRAGRRRVIVLGSAGAFLALSIGYWALSGSDDDPAPAAAPAAPAQVLRTQSIEPLAESTTGPTGEPPAGKPTTRPVATRTVPPGAVLTRMQREIGVLVRKRELDRGDGTSLVKRLRKVSESLRGNDQEAAARRLEDFAEKLVDLHDDGDISDAGFNALAGQATQLAGRLPTG